MSKEFDKRSSPVERMKKRELYVVYGGFDYLGGWINFVSYGDRNRTPRIFGKNAFDERVGNLLICKNMATAKNVLRSEDHVLLPLSQMICVFGERVVKRWAKVQGCVRPHEVKAYVNQFVAKAA